MNVEMYEISAKQFEHFYVDDIDREVNINAAKDSSEILMAMFNGQPILFMGFIPRTTISDTIYVWMVVPESGRRHGMIIARRAKAVRDRIFEKYSCMIGHCFSTKSAMWLRSLGAEFISPSEFRIRREG